MATEPRVFPRIAAYHSGPYIVAAILQDPGTSKGHLSGAVTTGEVGVLNPDPTAALLKQALDANDIPLSAYVPLNAVPWYHELPRRPLALLQKGAAHNRVLILQHNVRLVLLLGKDAHRSARFLDLPSEVVVRKLPHPGRLGLINFHENGARIGAVAAKQRVFEGFRLP